MSTSIKWLTVTDTSTVAEYSAACQENMYGKPAPPKIPAAPRIKPGISTLIGTRFSESSVGL